MKKKMQGKEKLPIVLLAVVLVAAVGIGMTLALLSVRTNTVNNEFMVLGSSDLNAIIVEDNWDPDEALTVIPNQKVLKDPAIKNTNETGGLDEYVAMKITLTDGQKNVLAGDDYTKLAGLLDIQFDSGVEGTNLSSKWTLKSAAGNGAIYVYNSTLKPGETTEEIFKSVTLKKQASTDQLDWIKNDLKGFEIVVEGAAVQADEITALDAEKELVSLLSKPATP